MLQDYILWLIFGLFVGIAMAIDLGAIGALRNRLGVKESLSTKQSAEDKKKSTFKQALTWTIVWISLAVIFAGIIYLTAGFDVYKIPMEISLIVIFVILGIALGLSAIKLKTENNSHVTLSKQDFDSKKDGLI